MRHKVAVCGEKLIAEGCLDFLITRDDTEVAAVIATENDWQTDLIAWAERNTVRTFVGNLNKYRHELAVIAPDFLFSIQYRALLKEPILRIPALGCLNLHFGLLPRYARCYPTAWSILNGEERAGVTLHYMSPRFDQGDIVCQQSIAVGQTTTARELFDELTRVGVDLFESIYPDLIAGRAVRVPQDLTQTLYYPKDSIDFKRDSILDWGEPALQIQRRICAFTFEPFQLARTGIRLTDSKTVMATVRNTRLHVEPSNGHSAGEIVRITEDGAVIVKGGDEGSVQIGTIDGKDAGRFIRGLGVRLQDIRFVKPT